MANTLEVQTLNDGPRNLVLKVHVDGDGTGDYAAQSIVDISSYNGAPTHMRINRVIGSLSGFTAELIWDATTDKHCLNVPDYEFEGCFAHFGGLTNNAGAGKTGDLLLTTTGLGAGDTGHLVIEMVKHYEPSW